MGLRLRALFWEAAVCLMRTRTSLALMEAVEEQECPLEESAEREALREMTAACVLLAAMVLAELVEL